MMQLSNGMCILTVGWSIMELFRFKEKSVFSPIFYPHLVNKFFFRFLLLFMSFSCLIWGPFQERKFSSRHQLINFCQTEYNQGCPFAKIKLKLKALLNLFQIGKTLFSLFYPNLPKGTFSASVYSWQKDLCGSL